MKNFLFEIFQFSLKVLDGFFPKSNNTIIFPIDSYKDYKDNRRFLFDSLSKFQEIDCVILFFNKEKVVSKRYVNFYTLKGITYWLRARYIVIDHGTADIPFSHSLDYRRRRLVNLWHGIPLKNLGYKMKNQNDFSLELEFEKYDSMICSSTLDFLAMRSCFKKTERNMWLTGLPRNDFLFFSEDQISKDLKKGLQWLDNKIEQRRMVLYMPTWRDNIDYNPAFNEEEISQLGSLLESKNAVLGVKNHPNAPSIDFGSLPIIDLSKSPCSEVGVFLRKADILITDYSSVWVDFLLLDRPIVSYCPDFSNYEETRGFLYDYSLIFPGRVNETFDSFLKQLEVSLSNPIDSKQTRIKNLFHKFLDGNNSDRVSRKILSRLGI